MEDKVVQKVKAVSAAELNKHREIELSPGVYYDPVLETTYVYDTSTKNISFLQTSRDLKSLGVNNNKFFLKLYDISLKGVDPYSNVLSEETVFKINIEIIRNPWYFLREISRIPEEGGAVGPGSGMPFQLNRGNLASAWCFFNNVDHYLVLPRQIG